jgi:hypothetical protein
MVLINRGVFPGGHLFEAIFRNLHFKEVERERKRTEDNNDNG